MTNREWLSLAVLGGVGYFAYQALAKVGSAAGKAVDSAATGIANAWVWAANSNIIPTGNVILPSGQKIPTSQLAITWDQAAGVASFVFNGYGYIIAPNPSGGPAYDMNGDYHAQ